MKIDEFIKEYNAAANKDECVKRHILDTYVPYEKKIALCKNVVKSANFVDNKYVANSPMQYMFFSLMLITTYTDLELDTPQNNLVGFNALDQLGLVDIFYSSIPEREFVKMKTILQMVSDDVLENERSLIAYLDTKIGAMNIALEGLEKALEKVMPDGTILKENN